MPLQLFGFKLYISALLVMFICFVCKAELASIDALVYHIKIRHILTPFHTIMCQQENCHRVFPRLNSYRRHLEKRHSSDSLLPAQRLAQNVENIPAARNVGNEDHSELEADEIISLGDNLENISITDMKESTYNAALRFVASLYASPTMNRAQVQEVLDNVSILIGSNFQSILKSKVKTVLDNSTCDETSKSEINSMFDLCTNPFGDYFNSEYKRFEALEASDCYVKPEKYVLGYRDVPQIRKKKVELVRREVCGQYVPMQSVLKHFLELPGVYEGCVHNIDRLRHSDNPLCNVVQGTIWRFKVEPNFPDKTVLPLFLYFDDMEPDVLGSHSGSHKVGCVYYNVACLPQEFQSKLENIFLALTFYSKDRVIYGNEATFKPLIAALKELAGTGIALNLPDGEKRVYFTVVLILGDNLGLHSILELVGSSSSNFPCRFCREPRWVIQKQVRVNTNSLRNRENYLEDLAVDDVSRTGVKGPCIWNSLFSFHVFENVSVDIMHDVFEGVCNYELSEVLAYFIYQRKLFTLETLNDRVLFFDYGPIEKGNRPPRISRENIDKGKFGFSASEMLCFLRHLCIIIGDLIPKDDDVWLLYLTLKDIVNILMEPILYKEHIPLLKTLIEEHHEMYMSLFEKHLTPKFHFMVHYPDLLILHGPLCNIQCMRWEAKHRPLKQTAKGTNSRKNLPLTLSIKHQLQLCARFLCFRGFSDEVSFIGRTSISLQRLYAEYPCVRAVLPQENTVTCSVASQICSKGTSYEIGMAVIMKLDDDPIFADISQIVVLNGSREVFFVLSTYITVGFSKHFSSYEVLKTDVFTCVPFNDIISVQPKPTYVRLGANGQRYVTHRCAM